MSGCDSGTRDTGDKEIDGGQGDAGGDTDSDTDSDSDTGTDTQDDLDSGLDDASTGGGDDNWRYDDAGSAWDDGSVAIESSCEGDCRYIYELSSGSWRASGQSYFEVRDGGGGTITVRGVDNTRFIYFINMSKYYGHVYRERLIAEYSLDAETHDLLSGEAFVYDYWAEVELLKNFTFSYDAIDTEFSYTLESNGRRWGRTLPSDRAPMIMFNHREYPIETWGSHSSLFAYLVGKHYDWDKGGEQQIRIFSPELERLDTIRVEADAAEDKRLIVYFPVDSLRPPKTTYSGEIATAEIEAIPIDYEYDIPIRIGAFHEYVWETISAPPFEISVPDMSSAADVESLKLASGFSSSSLSISSGNLTLAGEIDDPDATGPHPVVIMLPGWDHQTRLGEVGAVDLYLQLGAQLAAAGYMVLRTDSRGNGESDGDLTNATLTDLVGDVGAMLGALSSVPEADTSKVFLLAMDLGACVAAEAQRDLSPNLAGTILLAPFTRDFETWGPENYAHYLRSAGFVIDEENGEADLESMKDLVVSIIETVDDGSYQNTTWRGHTPSSWKSIFGIDLTAEYASLGSTLIVTGQEDHFTAPEMGQALHSAMQDAGVDSTLADLPGLTHALTPGTSDGMWPEHGSMEEVDEAAVDAIVNWLDVQTGGTK